MALSERNGVLIPSPETQPTTDALHAIGAQEFLAPSSRVMNESGNVIS